MGGLREKGISATTVKELLSIVERLKQFKEILFGYKINVFSNHKSLVYEATLSQSIAVSYAMEAYTRRIRHIPILHIAGLDNVVADTLSCLPLANTDESSPSTLTDMHQANELLFALDTNDESFPLSLLLVLHREQQKEVNKWNSKLQHSLTNFNNYNQQEGT